jgi:hypothetical protein
MPLLMGEENIEEFTLADSTGIHEVTLDEEALKPC